jgi:predicted small secreted protein
MLRSFILLAVAATALGACNTIEGAGRDIQRAGEAVQDAAD